MSSQIYGHLCIWKSTLNSKLLGNTDCLHWIWTVLIKKWRLSLLTFHSCVPCLFYILLLPITEYYYHILVSTKYHWNISFPKKFPAKYVVKKDRSVTHFVWQTFFHLISSVCQIKNIKYINQNLTYYETIVPLL